MEQKKRRDEIKHLYCYLLDLKNKPLYKHEGKKLPWTKEIDLIRDVCVTEVSW